ncbi:hypothetical protein PVL30_001073 [Lodderomyces elongisporus]|uniref:uncharacterized protein n=1 Tax=Lodderomyces elongisporus TaxID=36914 RepID=UPI002920B908|nr:uncharacterized protein PVL30_001073 [Lodderomyces elongisporus]WLF77361.1 hypothetical protein PVL30_001073 [Lodderomyces elongisporus]
MLHFNTLAFQHLVNIIYEKDSWKSKSLIHEFNSFTIVNYSLKEELLLIGELREFSPMKQYALWSSESIRDYTRKYQIAHTVNTL